MIDANAESTGIPPQKATVKVQGEVQGTKLPFKMTTTWTDGQSTIELADVQTNAVIDPARFRQPPPAAPLK